LGKQGVLRDGPVCKHDDPEDDREQREARRCCVVRRNIACTRQRVDDRVRNPRHACAGLALAAALGRGRCYRGGGCKRLGRPAEGGKLEAKHVAEPLARSVEHAVHEAAVAPARVVPLSAEQPLDKLLALEWALAPVAEQQHAHRSHDKPLVLLRAHHDLLPCPVLLVFLVVVFSLLVGVWRCCCCCWLVLLRRRHFLVVVLL